MHRGFLLPSQRPNFSKNLYILPHFTPFGRRFPLSPCFNWENFCDFVTNIENKPKNIVK